MSERIVCIDKACKDLSSNTRQEIYLDMQKKGYSEKFWVPRFFFIAIRCTFDIYTNCSITTTDNEL